MGHHLTKGIVAAAALAALLAGCAGHDPQSIANDATRAVYDDDLSGVRSLKDATLLPQVSPAVVGMISDKMHELGSYDGLTPMASDPVKHEYTYRADFAKGSVNVVIRIGGDGKLAAYRVFPTGP